MAKFEDVLYHSTNQPTALRGVAERIRKDGRKVYDARIGYASGKNKHIGTFWTAEAAALAWDMEARLKRGKEALTNFPEEYAATRGSPWAFKVPANKAEAARMLELGSSHAVGGTGWPEGGGGGKAAAWARGMGSMKQGKCSGAGGGGRSSPESDSAHVERKSRSERQRSNGAPSSMSKGTMAAANDYTGQMSKGMTSAEVATTVITIPGGESLVQDKVPRKVRTRDGKRKVERAADPTDPPAKDNDKGSTDGEGNGGHKRNRSEGGNSAKEMEGGVVPGSLEDLMQHGYQLDNDDHKNTKQKAAERQMNAEARRAAGASGGVFLWGGSNHHVKKGSSSSRRRKWMEKKYKGITKRFTAKGETVWHVQIVHQGKCLHLGTVRDPMEGAVIWDAKARELRGEDTETNFPLGFIPPPFDHSPIVNNSPVNTFTPPRRARSFGAEGSNRNTTNVDTPEELRRAIHAEESEGGSQYWENGGVPAACNHRVAEEEGEVEVTGGCGGRRRQFHKSSAVIAAATKDPPGSSFTLAQTSIFGERKRGEGGKDVSRREVGMGSKGARERMASKSGRTADEYKKEEEKQGEDEEMVQCVLEGSGRGQGGERGGSTPKDMCMWGAEEGEEKWDLGEEELEWDDSRPLDSDVDTTGFWGEGAAGFGMTKHVGVFEKKVDVTTRVFEVWVGLGATKKRCLGAYETEEHARLVFESEQRRVMEHMIGSKRTNGASQGQGKLKRFKLLSSLP